MVGQPGKPMDFTLAAYRANAAAAMYSRVVAMQMYGDKRPYGYAYGGSGGGFGDGADSQIDVDAGDKRSGELEPLTSHGAESLQAECEGVDPGAQIDNPVLTAAVGHGGPDLLDESRTGRFDRHAGQDAARRIFHNSSNRRLGVRK